ncbi:MAG: hypothetical protein IEMM0008_0855 [bacterium]|nr:MAG: hypothetical protein IEMM0008_0855 [bacterium]
MGDLVIMLKTLLATIENGKVELLEDLSIPEGSKLLVTLLEDGDDLFWQKTSEASLNSVWDNKDDDIYHDLLSK